MQYGVGEASRILEVNRDVIKSWAYKFSEYLSKDANPEKGRSRTFSIEDIRVFAYISGYWEEEPDIDHIKAGLNFGYHRDNELIDNLIIQVMPLFQFIPEEIDQTWRGTVFGGEFCLGELFDQANSFKLAGDRLVQIAFDNYKERELFQPAIYNYRHAVELYMKSVVGERKTHDLKVLLDKLKIIIKQEFNSEAPDWFINLVLAFHNSDPGGTTFRYGAELPETELYCDMRHVKKVMGWFSVVFKRIRIEQEK